MSRIDFREGDFIEDHSGDIFKVVSVQNDTYFIFCYITKETYEYSEKDLIDEEFKKPSHSD